MDWSRIEQEVQYQTQALVQQYSNQRHTAPISNFGRKISPKQQRSYEYHDTSLALPTETSQRERALHQTAPEHKPAPVMHSTKEIDELKTMVLKQQNQISALEKRLNTVNDMVDSSHLNFVEKVFPLLIPYNRC